MDKIDRMRAFALVAKNTSFTQAAQRLGRSARLVSKYVADLEEDLGVQLLYRTTRSVSLTEAGATYLAMCEPLLDGFDELEEAVKNTQSSLRGVIRISAPTGFGALRLAPSLATFAADHPEIEIDLQLSDRRVSIIEEGLDLAVRIGPMRDSSLMIRQLGPMPLIVCASPAYLDRAGRPTHPSALTTHECVRHGSQSDTTMWRFDMMGETIAVPVTGRLTANAPAAAAQLAAAGVAIARCPAYTVAEMLRSGDLIELFPKHRVAPYVVAALFPQNRRLSTRVRALIDHLAKDPQICDAGA
ncbi:D-malate degradation protein R [Tritonibacter multivorans]|uniref:D-malate degradation protein R n=1 Tax=Tritonibacter multivorans TaxID=928856 RepID=A0A0P1GR84_9RHOB|nr:LysR family transcriptional regulator [Tritonibacter multivorans]MDA7421908.1 LysR family transcriptional regulator [Tritonibacter multivorans]CUH76613.1 D-malate degradation protein R [Tritonibacter multivorans]SFD47979.1 transcriptional regulator, LysR family [Tritonibacter multivorans]